MQQQCGPQQYGPGMKFEFPSFEPVTKMLSATWGVIARAIWTLWTSIILLFDEPEARELAAVQLSKHNGRVCPVREVFDIDDFADNIFTNAGDLKTKLETEVKTIVLAVKDNDQTTLLYNKKADTTVRNIQNALREGFNGVLRVPAQMLLENAALNSFFIEELFSEIEKMCVEGVKPTPRFKDGGCRGDIWKAIKPENKHEEYFFLYLKYDLSSKVTRGWIWDSVSVDAEYHLKAVKFSTYFGMLTWVKENRKLAYSSSSRPLSSSEAQILKEFLDHLMKKQQHPVRPDSDHSSDSATATSDPHFHRSVSEEDATKPSAAANVDDMSATAATNSTTFSNTYTGNRINIPECASK